MGLGVPQDYAKAMTWYRKAAEQGDVGAQTNMGTIYSDGLGVQQNFAEALAWFRSRRPRFDDRAKEYRPHVPERKRRAAGRGRGHYMVS